MLFITPQQMWIQINFCILINLLNSDDGKVRFLKVRAFKSWGKGPYQH